MSSSSPSFMLSSVTVAVDKATSELLLNPDWTMNIAICDSVNYHRWQTKDAVKAVKRRLQHKSAKVQMLALTLLEAMVKNCGECLHFQIAEKHLLGEMIKIVKKKGDFEVRNKILVLLDTWREAFGGYGCKYSHYNWAYEELRRSGVRFPERKREAALMHKTPSARPCSAESASFRRLDETMATEIETLSLSSLESTRNVMDLLSDMVQAVNPGDQLALKDEVLVDLVDRCRSNQKKLIQMLTTTADEEVLARGLELNDLMQVVLARHDAIASGKPFPLQAANSSSKSADAGKKPEESKLIEPSTKSIPGPESVASYTKSETDVEEEEDDFAQLARRHAQPCNIPSETNACAEESEYALLISNNRTSDQEAAPEATQCKELAVSDPAAPLRTQEEQDVIDLLSLTLSTTTAASHQQHLSTSNTDLHSPFSGVTQAPPRDSDNHDQMLLNSYVVPWAQPQFPNPHSPSQPQPQPQPMMQPQPQPQSQSQNSQFSYQYPPPPWVAGAASFTNACNNILWSQQEIRGPSRAPVQAEKQLYYSNSFPTRGSNNKAGETRLGNTMNGVMASVQKPYIPPYRLFEDLNVYWNADERFKVANNTSSGFQANHGESMLGGRKYAWWEKVT